MHFYNQGSLIKPNYLYSGENAFAYGQIDKMRMQLQ